MVISAKEVMMESKLNPTIWGSHTTLVSPVPDTARTSKTFTRSKVLDVTSSVILNSVVYFSKCNAFCTED